ncbi:MAG: DegT/DnrJ/EryC1/StrS family aminotransferase [Fibrobacter sp.]|nr:DegT/DnrJ/EryC1/StrS family aminotransferase [Fibrobacter sp.]
MREKFLVFGSPAIGQEEIDEVVATMRSGWLGTGPKTHQFEQEFAAYLGVKHCLAVSSCTAALHLSMLAAGIGPGDEVIVPSMTFCASANAVIHTGARPVFADCTLNDMVIDPQDIKRKITSRTRAILPVHFHGRPVYVDEIREIAEKYNLFIIDDAAHAIETEYKGRKIGQFADCTCFSFYVTKNLTTVEGGMIATNNDEWADRIKIYALHGMSKDAWARFSDKGYKHYQVVMPGYKYNMTDLQASIGLHQLHKMEKNWIRRQNIWNCYNDAFKDLPLDLPSAVDSSIRHAYHLYAIRVLPSASIDRDTLMQKLHDAKIGTGVHYTALHLHPYYSETYGYKQGDFPNAEKIGDTTLSIPLSAALTDDDVTDVIDAVRGCLQIR